MAFRVFRQGLIEKSTGDIVSLQSMKINSTLIDTCVEIDWIQKYHNKRKNPIETLYLLLLPLKTAITKFIVTVDNKKIKGVVKSKEKSEKEYSDAISTGGSAFLLEKSDRSDVNEFKITVGNLPPEKFAVVELSFVTYLNVVENQKGKQRLLLPLELFPNDPNIEFEITCSIFSSNPLLQVTTSEGTVSDDKRQVTLQHPLTKDFIVEIETESGLPQALLEVDPNDTNTQTVMISHYVDFAGLNIDFLETKVDIILVVDRSGSMSGDRIQQTRIAMNMLIHAIPADSIFNIVGFGSTQDWLFPESAHYTEQNLHTAESKINQMGADLGGTDLLTPLRRIFSKPTNPDYPRIIIILTDGAVDDRGSIIAEVKRHSEEIRLYSLGIGTGVDRTLVTGISEAGRGKSEFVENSQDIEEHVMRLFSEALTPCVSQLRVHWPSGVNVLQSPYKIQALRNGDRLVCFGLLEGGEVGNDIVITGVDPEGKELKWVVPVGVRKGETIKKLAAFSLIRDLQEEKSYFQEGGAKPGEKVKQEIIFLGVKYQLASNHTSFIATIEGDTATTGELILEQILLAPPPEPDIYKEKEKSQAPSPSSILPMPASYRSSSTSYRSTSCKMFDWSDSDFESDGMEEDGMESEGEDKSRNIYFEKYDSWDSDSDNDKRVIRSAQEKRFDEMKKWTLKIESSMRNEDWRLIGSDWGNLVKTIQKAKSITDKVGYPVFYISFLCGLDDMINGIDKNALKSMKPKKAYYYNSIKKTFKRFLKDSEGLKENMAKYCIKISTKNPFFVDEANKAKDDPKDDSKTKVLKEDEQPWTQERTNKKLQDMLHERGKKNYVTSQVHEHIKFYHFLMTKVEGVVNQLVIRFRLVNAQIDTNLGTSHLNINTWKRIYNELVTILDILFENPQIILDEETDLRDFLEEISKRPDVVCGHLLFSLEKLHEEFLRSLQNIDPHVPEYISRLSNEHDFLLLLQYAEKFYERQNDNKRLVTLALRQLDYLYYKRQTAEGNFKEIKVPKEEEDKQEEPSNKEDSFDTEQPTPEVVVQSIELSPPTKVTPYVDLTATVERLTGLIYHYCDDDQLKRRATLQHIYHLALHDKFTQGRDLLLMTHLTENMNKARPPEQVMFNRALVQLGLAAFREGCIEDASNCLQDILQNNKDKAKELLAQGIVRNQVQKNTEQEKQERSRQIPYHMHINLDLVEAVLLVSGMLLEIPNRAQSCFQPDRDSKRKILTKYFRKSFDYHERQLFTGPPENTKEAVMVAAKALERGDWVSCSDLIQGLNIWRLLPGPVDTVRGTLVRHIQEVALKTYLATYAQYYGTLHVNVLAEMFKLPQTDVHSLVSSLIMRGELHASLDQPSGAIVIKTQDPPTLQAALAFAEKANSLLTPTTSHHPQGVFECRPHVGWTEQQPQCRTTDRGDNVRSGNE